MKNLYQDGQFSSRAPSLKDNNLAPGSTVGVLPGQMAKALLKHLVPLCAVV